MSRSIRPYSAGRARLSRISAGLLLAAATAFAHHSIAGYDLVHGTIVEGVVTAFVWENPHAQLYLDVAAENEVEHWTIQLESPKVLRDLGWDKDTVKAGQRVSVTGGRAKNGTCHLRAAWVVTPSGRKLPALPPPES